MGGVSKGLRGDGGDGPGAISRRLRGTEEGIQIAGDGSTLQGSEFMMQGQRALGRPLQGISCCLSETVTRERTRTSRQRASKEAADSAVLFPPFPHLASSRPISRYPARSNICRGSGSLRKDAITCLRYAQMSRGFEHASIRAPSSID